MQLARPEDLRMTCQDLLRQSSAGTGQSEDEDGQLRFQAETAVASKPVRSRCGNHGVNESSIVGRAI